MSTQTVDIQAEVTPNPNTLKFRVTTVLLESGSVNFPDKSKAKGSPLAERLFGIENILGVMVGHDFITVTKNPEEGTTTQTDMGNGRTHTVNEKGDGTKTVTVKEGKKQSTTEYYDKDGKLTKTEKTNSKGETTTEYPDPNKPEGEDSSFDESGGNGNPFGDNVGMNGTTGSSSVGRDMAEHEER